MEQRKNMLKNKIRSARGFTLAETLLAVIILLLAAAIVATGVPAARNAYEKVVLASNAEILLSTSMSTLRNELGMAKSVEVKEDRQTIVFFSEMRKTQSKIYLNSDDDMPVIKIQRYYKESDKDAEGEWLVTQEASTANLYVTYREAAISENGEYITFTDLSVMRRSVGGGSELVKRDRFSVRLFSE